MEIGNTLREARRARGLTLEEVEEETKIRKKYIMAMEMEQFEVLPGPIYAKAFLKNYAKFLNINLDEILEAFKQKHTGESVKAEHDKPVEEKIVKAKRKQQNWIYVAAVLLIVAVVVSIYYGTRGTNSAAVNEGEQRNTDQIAAPDNTGQQQVPFQDNTVNITGVKVVLNVKSDRSWVLVVVDGKQAFQGEIAVGESKSFEGNEIIYIKLGNAGAVEVLENDKSIGFLGAAGEVINREFKAPTS